MPGLKVVTSDEAKTTDEYDAALIGEGICYATVCHRVGVDSQTAIYAAAGIAGTSGGWQFQDREELPDSWWEGTGASEGRETPYPQPCAHHPETHVHVLAAC